MSNTSTVEQIKSALTDAGYGGYVTTYANQINRAAGRIDGGEDAFAAMRAEAGSQVSDYTLRRFASGFEAQQTTAETPEPEYLTESQVAKCVDIGVRLGASAAAVREALVDAGLVEPEPEPEPEPEDDSTEGSFASIKATLDSLVAFARRHGFNG